MTWTIAGLLANKYKEEFREFPDIDYDEISGDFRYKGRPLFNMYNKDLYHKDSTIDHRLTLSGYIDFMRAPSLEDYQSGQYYQKQIEFFAQLDPEIFKPCNFPVHHCSLLQVQASLIQAILDYYYYHLVKPKLAYKINKQLLGTTQKFIRSTTSTALLYQLSPLYRTIISRYCATNNTAVDNGDDPILYTGFDCTTLNLNSDNRIQPKYNYIMFRCTPANNNYELPVNFSDLNYIYLPIGERLSEEFTFLQQNGNILTRENEYIYDGKVYKTDVCPLQTCTNCGREFPQDMYTVGSTTCHLCEEDMYKIHTYSTKAESLLQHKLKDSSNSDKVFLGIELEYNSTTTVAPIKEIGSLIKNHAIMKKDGSLSIGGVEIVTIPDTMDVHKKVFENFFLKLPKNLTVGQGTGMHVHVSKQPYTTLSLSKVCKFMNTPKLRKLFEAIAGRSNSNFAAYGNSESSKISTLFKTAKQGSRYQSVNMTPSKTFEFRIFKTPKNYEDFCVRLEFVDAVANYCLPGMCKEGLKDFGTLESFLKFLKEYKKDYKNILKFILTFINNNPPNLTPVDEDSEIPF